MSTNDTLTVTFNYRFPTAPGAMGSGFRVGLFNSGGSKQTSDTTGSRSDDTGFEFNTDPGTTAGTSTQLKMEGTGDDILGGSVGPQVALSSSMNGGSVASGTTKHSASLQITRLLNGDLQFTAQIDSATAATGTESAASVVNVFGVNAYTFDEFAFGFGGTGYRPTILVDNVVVTATTGDTTPPTINAPVGGFTPLTLTTRGWRHCGPARLHVPSGDE